MEKEAIYYLSDIKWFSKITSEKYKSKKEVLKAHLKYVEKSKDFVAGTGNIEEILKDCEKADKRVNSRIACSFVFAVPNDLKKEEVKEWIEEVRELLANLNNMKKENIYIGFHESIGISGEKNNHLHIVMLNLDKNNKAIPLGRDRNQMSKMHNELQKYIQKKGYSIKKSQEKGIHIGVRMRYDEELKNAYLETIQSKKEIEKIEKMLNEKPKPKPNIYVINKNKPKEELQIKEESKKIIITDLENAGKARKYLDNDSLLVIFEDIDNYFFILNKNIFSDKQIIIYTDNEIIESRVKNFVNESQIYDMKLQDDYEREKEMKEMREKEIEKMRESIDIVAEEKERKRKRKRKM